MTRRKTRKPMRCISLGYRSAKDDDCDIRPHDYRESLDDTRHRRLRRPRRRGWNGRTDMEGEGEGDDDDAE